MKAGHPIPLSVDKLLAKSRELTGMAITDHEVVEPLTVLHRSLCEDSRLHEQGALAWQNRLLRLLSNRLRMQRDFAQHPQIADERIEAPVFVMGMGRSGTTKTQKVLAASGDFNWLPFWQAYNPALLTGSRGESTAQRIREADDYCRWFDQASPESKYGHSFETHEPEEDSILTEGSLRTISFLGWAEIPGYLQWMAGQGALPMFTFLRDSLKYLQWQGLASAAKRWLLKSPIYYGLEPELLKVFPDARLVMTHRTPLETVPSACKLIDGFHQPFDQARSDPQMLNMGFAMQMDRHLALRESHGIRLLDLCYEDVLRSMETVLEKIYAFIGLPLTDAARRRMSQWGADNPLHRRGAFKYSLEEFGLGAEQVKQSFARYLAFIETLAKH